MKLDDRSAAGLELPSGKRELIVFDEDLPGFGIRLREGGKRTWILQYRIGKKQRRKTLGAATKAMNAAKARAAADKDLARVKLGGDPQAQKVEQRARAIETFDAVAARFLKRQHARLKPRSYEQITTHLTKHWAPFKGLPVHEITRRHVATQLGKIAEERGPFAANRARTTLSSFFAWAIGAGLVDANPVVGTNRAADENQRDRVLDDAELVEVWNACRDDDHGRIVKLLMLTGARRDEVGWMTKAEISLSDRKWNIESKRTKNKRPHEVPLSGLAIGLLEEAINLEGRGGREHIFGDGARAKGSADRGFSGWSKAKRSLDERIERIGARRKCSPWVLHDIRRTVATRMGELGVLPHAVEAVLNHISGHKAGVAGVYNRALYSAEKRQALDVWGAHMEALIAEGPRAT
jgi:integrase